LRGKSIYLEDVQNNLKIDLKIFLKTGQIRSFISSTEQTASQRVIDIQTAGMGQHMPQSETELFCFFPLTIDNHVYISPDHLITCH